MNPLDVLRDSFYFFQRNLGAILKLCLPWIVLEAVLQRVLDQAVGADAHPGYSMTLGLLVSSLYTAALILFMDARSRGLSPENRAVLTMALALWPRFLLLTATSAILVVLGLSLYVLPGLWLMVTLGFADFFLLLRGLTPLGAIKQSFRLSHGHFLRILLCLLCAMTPLLLLNRISLSVYPLPREPALAILFDSAESFLQLFASVVLFRLYMLISDSSDAK